MKNPGTGVLERNIFPVQQPVGAGLVEERSPPRRLHRHYVGVGSGRRRCPPDVAGFDPLRPAILEDEASVVVLSNQTGSAQRKGSSQPCQVLEQVIRRPAVACRLLENPGQPVLLGIAIDDLDSVDDPVPTGEHPTPILRQHRCASGRCGVSNGVAVSEVITPRLPGTPLSAPAATPARPQTDSGSPPPRPESRNRTDRRESLHARRRTRPTSAG